jgi:hypothetical protein
MASIPSRGGQRFADLGRELRDAPLKAIEHPADGDGRPGEVGRLLDERVVNPSRLILMQLAEKGVGMNDLDAERFAGARREVPQVEGDDRPGIARRRRRSENVVVGGLVRHLWCSCGNQGLGDFRVVERATHGVQQVRGLLRSRSAILDEVARHFVEDPSAPSDREQIFPGDPQERIPSGSG